MNIFTTTLLILSGVCRLQQEQPDTSCYLNEITSSQTYLFYIHGQITIENGKGISKYWGVYEYQSILDTLSGFGYNVISEVRPVDSDEKVYATRITGQIDSLLTAGVNPARICVVGASAGAYIAMEIAERVKNDKVKYVIMGMCWPDTYKSFVGKKHCGNFLSIYEFSDPHGSCMKLFDDKDCKTGFDEIKLNMNNSHSFLYKPYREWVYPMVNWIDKD